MKDILCILLLLTAWCVNLEYVVSQQCEASSVGTRFVFGMIGWMKPLSGDYVDLHIIPVRQQPTHIQVKAPFINRDNTYMISNYTIIPLERSLLQVESGKQYKGIEISSDGNISLTVVTQPAEVLEGFLALPVNTLGTRYIAASYIPYSSYSSEVLIAGVENDTDVFLSTVIGGHQSSNRTFRLQKFETYQFKAYNDVSGSVVSSNKPVAVFSGSSYAKVPVGIGDAQYLVEQMIPTKYWTTKFIIPPVYPRKHFVLKFFADQDNTEIQYYNSTNQLTLYMNAHSLVELTFGTDPVVVLANKPISVIQYGHDGDNMAGDPFMANTQGISQFQDSYKFITQNYFFFSGSNTIAITILKNSTSGLLLNGQTMSYLNAKNVSVSPPMDQYVTLFVNVLYNSYYHLYHSGGEKFGAVIYGRINSVTGYGYPLQLSFTDRDCETHVPSTKTTFVHSQTTTFTTPTYSNLTTQGGKGTWCFHCDGMTHLQFCDWVERCQTEDEVCYVQRYSRSIHANLYRSGCINRQQCNGGDGNGGCVQCCNGSFCNSEGCGDRGFQQLSRRGPLCFDCTHKGEHETCNTVQLCDANQVCMIEKYKWGEDFHNIMGCASSQVCANKRSVRGLEARHAPVCSQCCHTDFCNMNCTSVNTGVAIIG